MQPLLGLLRVRRLELAVGEGPLDELMQGRHAVAREDRFEVALHRGESGAPKGVDVARCRIRCDLHTGNRRSRSAARRERVVEADRSGLPEDIDGQLQALVGLRERSEVDAELAGEDLMAQTHRQQRCRFDERVF